MSRSILQAGSGVPTLTAPRQALVIEPPATMQRPLSAYRLDDLTTTDLAGGEN